MGKQLFILAHDVARQRAVDAVKHAPAGFRVVIDEPKRNLDQNARMWAMLRDVSEQVEWYGNRLTDEDWKNLFTAVLKDQRTVPGINGGFVVMGLSTSRMTKGEMSELIELMFAFGAERGVVWSDPQERQAA